MSSEVIRREEISIINNFSGRIIEDNYLLIIIYNVTKVREGASGGYILTIHGFRELRRYIGGREDFDFYRGRSQYVFDFTQTGPTNMTQIYTAIENNLTTSNTTSNSGTNRYFKLPE